MSSHENASNPAPVIPVLPSHQQADEATSIVCPQCGYDLRSIESDRCPECGLKIDRDAALHSLIPWTYRRANGRIRTYFQTVWMMTKGTRRFRDETARPVSYRDARRFWMVTATLVSLLLIIPAAAFGLSDEPDNQFTKMLAPHMNGVTPGNEWQLVAAWDGMLPWATGTQFAGLLPLLTIALTFSNLAMLPLLLNRRSLSPTQRARAVALGHYACAPLAWWFVLAVLTVALLGARLGIEGQIVAGRGMEFFVWGSWYGIALIVPPLITLIRSAGLYAALTHGDSFARLLAGRCWCCCG